MNLETEPDFAQLERDASEQVEVGGTYGHYKNAEKRYVVVTIAIDEATERPAVVYKALYGDGTTWIRSVENFLETVETPEGPKPRFLRI